MLAGRMFRQSVDLIRKWSDERKKDVMYIELVVITFRRT